MLAKFNRITEHAATAVSRFQTLDAVGRTAGRGRAKIRPLGLAFGFSLLLLGGRPIGAQEPNPCSLAIPVMAVGQGTTFFQDFRFLGGTQAFPGLWSGELETGGFAVQEVKVRVARQVQRTVYDYVVVFRNGRPVVERRARIVVETVYVEVPQLRPIALPPAKGAWTSIELCLFSTWNIYHLGPDGLVLGAGSTVGNQLYGSVLYFGIEGLPAGWYQLTTGATGGDGGGGDGGDPPPEP